MTPAAFRWAVRVYYEDSDAAGVVYYANYLRYLERARTEWLGSAGHPLAELERDHGIVFVVRRVEVDYRRPARLFDGLVVTAEVESAGGASLVVRQQVLREEELLVSARVMLACVDRASFRPARLPAGLSEALAR